MNAERWIAWAGSDEPDPLYQANEFGGEAGEILNVVKKLVREARGWRGSRATVDDLADEIADGIICLDSLARSYGIDLALATVRKFNATSDKQDFPHKLATLSDAHTLVNGGDSETRDLHNKAGVKPEGDTPYTTPAGNIPAPAPEQGEAKGALDLAEAYASKRDWNGAYNAMKVAYSLATPSPDYAGLVEALERISDLAKWFIPSVEHAAPRLCEIDTIACQALASLDTPHVIKGDDRG